jgi:hypothetical protein
VSLAAMSFILGGTLVAAGIFGGGLEMKELKLPRIGTAARTLSVIVGAIFIGLAVSLNPKTSEPAPTPAVVSPAEDPDPKKNGTTFREPMQGDLRLDFCLEWSQNCGQPAADVWCRTKGMSRALEFATETVGVRGTRLIGSNQVCLAAYCAGFTFITCER